MTKVDLITGFLGSGKTTFIKEYVRYLLDKGEKVGIIENDYGAINVDMLLLDSEFGDECRMEMVVAADPDCHRRRFKTKLIAMGMESEKLDRVIVEPSGIYDVDEFFDILYEEPLDRFYEIGNVIAIVDSGLSDDLSKESDYLLVSQIAEAGMVVFSKVTSEAPVDVYKLEEVAKLSAIWDSCEVLEGHHPVHISHIIPNFSDSTRMYDTWDSKNAFYEEAFHEYMEGTGSIKANYFKKLVSLINHRNYSPLLSKMQIKTCYQDMFSCFINVDGDLYACEKFCDEYKMGNVYIGFDTNRTDRILQKFAERKNKFCKSCWAQRLCRMCLTGLNHTDDEIIKMCEMERDTIDLALKYYCEMKDWQQNNK